MAMRSDREAFVDWMFALCIVLPFLISMLEPVLCVAPSGITNCPSWFELIRIPPMLLIFVPMIPILIFGQIGALPFYALGVWSLYKKVSRYRTGTFGTVGAALGLEIMNIAFVIGALILLTVPVIGPFQ